MILENINNPEDLKKVNEEDLPLLAQEIREFLIDNVTRTGGHLSSNLGVVELTIALHRVFNSPKDDIIWDVGHQAYVHKILTGRHDQFTKLRQQGGLSGYPDPKESPYDVIHAGHSSTSLSVAAGIAQAKKLNGDPSRTIAVIGDGSFTAGMVYEALNTLSHQKLPVIIILNDNGMSISPNVGGISHYFNHLRTSHSYLRFKRRFEFILGKMPGIGNPIKRLLYNLKEAIKEAFIPGRFFQDMGIHYYGPYKGHEVNDIIELLEEFKSSDVPVLLHVVTQKGKGYEPSEADPTRYHGVKGVAINGDGSIPLKKEGKSYSQLMGETLARKGAEDDKIIAVTAAMESGTGLKYFAKEFPGRVVDVGIAEQHAVVFGLGMSLKGYKPVVAIYSTFLQRGYDQLMHDVGISQGKVLFCIDRAGLVPEDGPTHQGVFDIAYLRTIPNMTVMMPASAEELVMMMDYGFDRSEGPAAIRYPKDVAEDFSGYDPTAFPIVPGEGVRVREGKDLIVVSTGVLLKSALEAASALEKDNISVEVYNLRFAKPISIKIVEYLAKDSIPVLILEEGVYNGGVSQYLRSEILNICPKKVEIVALPDEFPSIGTRDSLLTHYQLTTPEIVAKIMSLINN